MSILIKGMVMPTSCNCCRFAVDGWCYAYGKPNLDALANDGRTNFCPLVPVPPHGNLIDRDALQENCMKEDSFLAELLFRKVSNAPTIIQADPPKEEAK